MALREKLSTRFGRRTTLIALGGALIALSGGAWWAYSAYSQSAGDSKAEAAGPNGGPPGRNGRDRQGGGGRAQPVKASQVKQGNLDIVVSALGTVTAYNTATVKPRVDGQLVKINFRDGQQVKTGDVLAEIDPRPFQIALDQTHGQLLKDQALLSAAQVDLERYRALLAKDSIAKQQVDTQEALVRQYKGTVEADKALEDNARLQLAFTRVTAPAPGRLGLRQVDVGNMVRSSDTTGLVVITQTQPINVVFAIPSESIGDIVNRVQSGAGLVVEAWSRDGKTLLTEGKLSSIDNQIDVATGTVKLKAEFANKDNSLFPNQFINARLKVETRQNAVLLPLAAVQRNAQGAFVYRINKEDQTAAPRPVQLGPVNGETVIVEKGLEPGDQVVLDGADRLRPGGKVDVLSIDGQSRNADEARNGEGGDGAQGERRKRRAEGEEGRPPRQDAAADAGKPAVPGKTAAADKADKAPGGDKPAGSAPAARPAEGEANASRGERRWNRDEANSQDPEAIARRERWRQRREAQEREGGEARPAPRN